MIAKTQIDKNKIYEAISFLINSSNCRKKDFKKECELTIDNGFINFSITGILTKDIECKTSGKGKASFSLMGFYNVLQTYPEKELEIKIYQNKVQLENFGFNAWTQNIEPNKNYRKILLPINLTDTHILQLRYQDFSPEEIEFNELTKEIRNAEIRLKRRINKVARDFYEMYRIDEDELKKILTDMVNKKIGKD